MSTIIKTRTWKASGWSDSQYVQFQWVASTSNRTSSSVKVSVTATAKAYGVVKADLVAVGGQTTPYCRVNGIAFTFDAFNVADLLNQQSSSVTNTISGISSSSVSLLTTTSTLAGSSISLASQSGTSISVSAYVPPKSTPTLPTNAVIGTTYSINMNRNKSTYTHTMAYSVGGVIIWSAENIGATASLNAPNTDIISIADLCATIPSASYVNGTMTTKTYNGSTLIGTTTQSMNLYVPTYSVNFTASNVQADNTNTNVPTCVEYIKNYSNIKSSVSNFTTSYSATLQKYVISNGSNSSERTTDGDLSVAATNTSVKVRGIDSRGVYKDYDSTITLKTYVPPTLTTYNFTRGTNQLTLAYNGAMTELLNASSVGVNNITIKIYDDNQTEKASFTASHTNGVVNGTQTISWANLPAYTFNCSLVITDTFGSSATYPITIATAEVPMDLHWSKKGVAIGKVSETDGTNGLFEIAWTTLLKGNKLGFTQNGDWYYWKADGLTIAFSQMVVSCGSSTAMGNVYRADFTASIPSGIFSSTPFVFGALGERTQTLIGLQTGGASETSINGRVIRSSSSSGANILVNFIAVGV